jgi:hypothetical protein
VLGAREMGSRKGDTLAADQDFQAVCRQAGKSKIDF